MAFENQPKEPTSLAVRLYKEFKPDSQPLAEFNEERKQLTTEDCADFRAWFEAAGFPCK